MIDQETLNKVDQNMRSLVFELNRFPGIDTIDSCGGHVESIHKHSLEEGFFRVVVSIKGDEGKIGYDILHQELQVYQLQFFSTFYKRGFKPFWFEKLSNGAVLIYGKSLSTPEHLAAWLEHYKLHGIEDEEGSWSKVFPMKEGNTIEQIFAEHLPESAVR